MCKCLPKLSFCMKILFEISFCINNRGSNTIQLPNHWQQVGLIPHRSGSGLNLDASYVIYDNIQSLELDPDELDRNSYIDCLNRYTSLFWTISLALGSKLTLWTKFSEATLRFRLQHRLQKITQIAAAMTVKLQKETFPYGSLQSYYITIKQCND